MITHSVTDESEFHRVAVRHRRELHVHCSRMVGSFDDGEDLVQETFMRAWRSRATSAHADRVRGWLYRIATNVCLDELERRRRPVPSGVVPLAAPGADELAEQRAAIEAALRAAVERLSPRQRAVFVLRDVLDWSAADAAELLGMSVAASNSALQRARATLRPELDAAYAA